MCMRTLKISFKFLGRSVWIFYELAMKFESLYQIRSYENQWYAFKILQFLYFEHVASQLSQYVILGSDKL